MQIVLCIFTVPFLFYVPFLFRRRSFFSFCHAIPIHNIRHQLHNFGILQDCQNNYCTLADSRLLLDSTTDGHGFQVIIDIDKFSLRQVTGRVTPPRNLTPQAWVCQ